MNNMMTGNAVSDTSPQPQMGGYGRGMNPRMGMGLGGFGSFGGFGGGNGMSFNAGGFGGYGGFGGFNPMMGFGGFGGFNPMMGYGGMGGFGGFNPMMGFGGFNPMMGYGGMGGFGGFNPMMGMGLGSFGRFGNQFGGFDGGNPVQNRQIQDIQTMINNGMMSGIAPTLSVGVPGSSTYREYPAPSNQQAQPPQMGLNEVAFRSPQDYQNFRREESARTSIQNQLNAAFRDAQSSGKSLMDAAKEQDELEARLNSQYGVKKIQATPLQQSYHSPQSMMFRNQFIG